MSDGAHLLVPFAGCLAPGCREALGALSLPHLEKLLARLEPVAADEGDESSLSMPHERILAREYGIAAADGCLPWAAWQVAQAGRDTHHAGWAWITPCTWQVGTRHVAMGHPQDLQLDPQDSLRLMNAMQPYFEQDGIRLEYDAPTLWLARGELFRDLPAASLDRVVGRAIDPWIPRDAKAAGLRRLQQEMQMLLYTHPVNDERGSGGLLPVNSFWVSGTGALPARHEPAPPAGLHVMNYLRHSALRQDGSAWAKAWRELDATEMARFATLADKGERVRITLCGERGSRTWASGGGSWWKRLAGAFSRRPAAQWLEPL